MLEQATYFLHFIKHVPSDRSIYFISQFLVLYEINVSICGSIDSEKSFTLIY